MYYTMTGFKIVVGTAASGLFLVSSLLCSKDEWLWENITMPVIQNLDAEKSHSYAVKAASWSFVPTFKTMSKDKILLRTKVWGLQFDSPIGLAAGFDKHAQCINGMFKIGFDFVEVGSITPKSQVGNSKPRVFRLMEDEAVINRYGFNSYGADYARQNLYDYYYNRQMNGIVGVNLGKNKETKDAATDYINNLSMLGDCADYIVINISSPNTPGLRSMQGREKLKDLLTRVHAAHARLNTQPPLLIKVAPDLTQKDKEDICAVITDPKTSVDGLIVSNTTIQRPSSLQSPLMNESGGLSGMPLKDISTRCIEDMYRLTEGKIPIIGVGGVGSGSDAYEKIRHGASLVQLYSALVFHGPPIVTKIKKELAELLRNDGFSSVEDAVGCDVTLKT